MSAPTITWTITPEDPEVQWGALPDTFGDEFYACVALDDTSFVPDSDYDLPYRQEKWGWSVEDQFTAETVSEGTEKSESYAKAAAGQALLAAFASLRSPA